MQRAICMDAWQRTTGGGFRRIEDSRQEHADQMKDNARKVRTGSNNFDVGTLEGKRQRTLQIRAETRHLTSLL